MTTFNKQTLKTFFEQNDVPQGSDYANLIDSQVNIVESSAQSMGGALITPELITPRVSAGNVKVTGSLSIDGAVSAVGVNVDTLRANFGVITTLSATTLAVTASATFGNPMGEPTITIDASAGDLTMNGQLRVASNVFFNKMGNGAFVVNGNAQFTDSIDLTGSLAMGGNLTIITGTVTAANICLPPALVDAAGTNINTATLIAQSNNLLRSATDGSATGIRLPSNNAGLVQYVFNDTAVSANLWPCVGGQINALASGAAFGLTAKTLYTIIHTKASAYGVK